MAKPYSDRRWCDVPVGLDSECGNCRYWQEFGKCEKYPEKIPKELLDQSVPGIEKYKKGYCKFRKE